MMLPTGNERKSITETRYAAWPGNDEWPRMAVASFADAEDVSSAKSGARLRCHWDSGGTFAVAGRPHVGPLTQTARAGGVVVDPLSALVVKTVASKATEMILREMLGFQDRQAEQIRLIGDQLSSVGAAVDVLLQGPHRTARLWLSEAVTATDDQAYKLRRAREYLYEAYALATSPLAQSAVAREVALVLALQGQQSADWWGRAIDHGDEALISGAEEARTLVGRPPMALRRVTPEMVAAARRVQRKRWFGVNLSDQERFWRLAAGCLAAVQDGTPKDPVLRQLPATKAIQGLRGIESFNTSTSAAAAEAGVAHERLSSLTVVIELRAASRRTAGSAGAGILAGLGSCIQVVDTRLAGVVLLDLLLADGESRAAGMTVRQLLTAVGDISTAKGRRVIDGAGLSARRRVGTLTADERRRLLVSIRRNLPAERRSVIEVPVERLPART